MNDREEQWATLQARRRQAIEEWLWFAALALSRLVHGGTALTVVIIVNWVTVLLVAAKKVGAKHKTKQVIVRSSGAAWHSWHGSVDHV